MPYLGGLSGYIIPADELALEGQWNLPKIKDDDKINTYIHIRFYEELLVPSRNNGTFSCAKSMQVRSREVIINNIAVTFR